MINRMPQSQAQPLNIVGSSTFGRYPIISVEKTYNMLISDQWLIPYSGYQLAIDASEFDTGIEGRALHTSVKFNKLVCVIDSNVYLVNLTFNQQLQYTTGTSIVLIGELQTSHGPVYISENNKPQICFSDNQALYVYDPDLDPTFRVISGLDFTPGYLDFHDTYFLCASRNTNQWRLSAENDGLTWNNDSASVGLLETKPDNVQAVVRFPSKGNMIFVFGTTVAEPWFDIGSTLFPYQRNTSYNIDYGCLNPATIASMDEIVVWLAINEKSGPTIMYSDGGMPKQITTDGIDYLLSNIQKPSDSQAFLFRQDGHVIYHINFYSDNFSLFYDFNTEKFFHACDDKMNYFIASSVSFFNNQYYFLSKNNGNLYAFDTIFTTYDGQPIPRIRTCKNIRLPTQEYFIAGDAGFTIESGDTNYITQDLGPLYLTTEDGKKYITEGEDIFLQAQNGNLYITEDGEHLLSEQVDDSVYFYLITQQNDIVQITPRVDLSISTDGGEHFSSYVPYEMFPIGKRKNKLMWWQLGSCNNLVCQFRFQGVGRFVANDGVVNIRQ